MEQPTTVKVPAEGGELEVTFKCCDQECLSTTVVMAALVMTMALVVMLAAIMAAMRADGDGWMVMLVLMTMLVVDAKDVIALNPREPDLAAYSPSLGLNPVQRSTFARNLKKEGVYTKSQLRGQTYRSLFKGVGGDNDDEKLLEEKLSAAQARTGGRIPLNNAAEEADKVKEQVAGMKQQLQDARTKMEDAAKAGDADLANQAQLDNVLSQLSGIDVESANLSTAQQMSEMNAAIASGGFVNGRSLETRELIAFNGVFRGILARLCCKVPCENQGLGYSVPA
eukprot:s414_g3.t1